MSIKEEVEIRRLRAREGITLPADARLEVRGSKGAGWEAEVFGVALIQTRFSAPAKVDARSMATKALRAVGVHLADPLKPTS